MKQSKGSLLINLRMEIEQAFEKVAPGTKNVGRFQYLIYSCVCFVQILMACQMCLLVVLEPYLTQPESTYVQGGFLVVALFSQYHRSLTISLNILQN